MGKSLGDENEPSKMTSDEIRNQTLMTDKFGRTLSLGDADKLGMIHINCVSCGNKKMTLSEYSNHERTAEHKIKKNNKPEINNISCHITKPTKFMTPY